ncbi:MAG: hypothetical protein IJ537_00815 [Bacteroidaceae bacterium]|nr:hypothetical protein [Bacteroidaceae bacterium]
MTYHTPSTNIIEIDNVCIICASSTKNGRGKKVQPPYDTLTDEQQLAFYFLLEYFGSYATDREWNYIKQDAANYLEKATWYLGLTKKQAIIYRPHYQNLDKIVFILKSIKGNKQAFDFMVNNTYNLILLSEGNKRDEIGQIYYNLWENIFGYSRDEIILIHDKYMYRTDI